MTDICDDVWTGVGEPETTNTHSLVSHSDKFHQWKGLIVYKHEHTASVGTSTGDDSLLMFKMVQGCHCGCKETLGYLINQKVRP